MSKRIFALLLCVVMLIPCLVACSERDENDRGPYITMYLTDEIYDFDPAKAYYNQGTTDIVSLMFDTLFKLDENGKVVKSLAKDYKIVENEELDEYTMEITLNNTKWSNGQTLSAEDVVYAWRRLLDQNNSYAAASLLFDIKNARAIKEGDEAPDDLGVETKSSNAIIITFEGKIDYDQFLLNLTSLATAPLLESVVEKNPDWAKKTSTIVTSGAFKLGRIKYSYTSEKVIKNDNALKENGTIGSESTRPMKLDYFYLERNRYYYRNDKEDEIDSSVKPYRILVDCTKSDAELLKEFKSNQLFYMSNLPLSLRNDKFVKENVKVTDSLSTTVLYLNQAIEPFNHAEVRKALSLAIDRDAIAKKVVYAEAATGLVPPAVFENETGKNKDSFREIGGALIKNTKKDINAAKKLLNGLEIKPSDYSFSIQVAAYDEVHGAIADMIAASWKELGFDVTIEKVQPLQNNDWLTSLGGIPTDICDDIFVEALERGKYEVILCDSTAYTANAYSMLAPYAETFSGMALAEGTFELMPHRTGYNAVDYNTIMEAVYFVPYFTSLTENDYQTFGEELYTKEEFKTLYNNVKATYAEYRIKPTDDKNKWEEQKAKLLHAAEKILMMDMPVIPVVFNKNAVLVSEELQDVKFTYNHSADFRKTNLKNYMDYTFETKGVDADGKEVIQYTSIFESFPNIDWAKKKKK